MPIVQKPLGAQWSATLTEVTHSCGHKVRWHFFIGHGRRFRKVVELAEELPCLRCTNDFTLARGDAVFWPTGVAHMHPGPCGDEAPDVQRWLTGVGARIR